MGKERDPTISGWSVDEPFDRHREYCPGVVFGTTPWKRRNWKLSNRTEQRQSRSAGARGEEESSTRARLLITGTAPETGDEESRREGLGKKRTETERKKGGETASSSLERGVLPFGC